MKHAKQIPDDFMRRLPEPATYYASRVKGLGEPDAFGTVEGECPLARYPIGHRIRIDVKSGRFWCRTCGSGDLIFFHMLLTGLRHKPAVLQLMGERAP